MENPIETPSAMPETPAESSTTATRSVRTRNKSQRALEAEHLEKLMARAKAQSKDVAAVLAAESSSATVTASAKKPRVKGRKKKEVEEYCICRTSGDDGRAMIECGVCNDWFHFDCINLGSNDAELIHKYVCGSCETRTGEKTSHIYDIGIFPPPSPPPGFELAPPTKTAPKRKAKPRPAQKPSTRPSASASPYADSASEAEEEDGSSSSSDDASDVAKPSSNRKKPRLFKEPKAARGSRPPSSADKKPARKTSTSEPVWTPVPPGALPPARAHVLNRLTTVVEKLFMAKMDKKEAELYAIELESALWLHFKDVVGGKPIAGSKYKGQFNLLASSLSKELRPELHESIVSQTLTPSQVAVLTSADLASAERAKEIEAARQAVLEQTVKTKAAQEPTAIRLGRDGLERAEDVREKEMVAIQAAEKVARDTQFRRESVLSEQGEIDVARDESVPLQRSSSAMQTTRSDSVETPGHDVSAVALASVTPAAATAGASTSPSESPRPTPTRASFSLSSAWGAKDKGPEVDTADVEMAFGEDQTQLDLSDIVPEEPEEIDFGAEAREETEWEKFLAKPVVWSGSMSNPKFESPGPGPIVVRQVAPTPFPPTWNELLPRPHVMMTGRLPAKASLDFLVTARVSPRKRLIVAAWTVDPNAPKEHQEWFEAILEDYLAQGKHAVYHPYGETAKGAPIPQGAPREMYLVPLRPTDPLPDFAELTDGFDLPAERPCNMFLAAFVVLKDDDVRSSAPPAVPARAPSYALSPTTSNTGTPPLQSAKLQELMKNLNPAAIASLVGPSPPHGGLSPLAPVSGPSQQPLPVHLPPPGSQPPYGYQPGYAPPPPPGEYRPGYQPQGYQPGPPIGWGVAPPGYGPPPARDFFEPGPPHPAGWEARGPYAVAGGAAGPNRGGAGVARGGRGGRFEGAPRDNGWGSRGGAGGGRGSY